MNFCYLIIKKSYSVAQRYSLLFYLTFLLRLKKKLLTNVTLLKKLFEANNVLLHSVHEKNKQKVNLHSISFSSAFVRFGAFFFYMKKYALFRPHFYMSIPALTKLSHTGQKFPKKIFVKG